MRSTSVLAGAALALVLAACSGGGGGEETPAPRSTATRQGVDPAGPQPPSSTATPSVAISTAEAVELGDPADLRDGVTVTIRKPRQVETEVVPGEIAGPAVAVDVSVANTGSQPFSLTGMVVTATFGDDEVPGDTSSSTPSAELTGDLPAGETKQGVYVFRIPDGEKAGELHLEVSSDQAPTVLRFDR